MPIGLFNNLYEPYHRGGAEVIVNKMATKLIAAGQKVFIVTTRPQEKAKQKELEKDITNRSNYNIYYLNSSFYNLAQHPPLWRLIWQISNLFNIRKYWQIKKILLKEKPELVITHNLMGLSFLVPHLLKKLKIKQQHFLHDIQLLHPSGLMLYGQEKKISTWPAKIYQILTRLLFASPAKIISPSSWLLKEHEQRGFFKNSLREIQPFSWLENITTDEPSVNIQSKTNPLQDEHFAEKKVKLPSPIFLFVGQIESHKGILLLISAFKKIPQASAQLIIVGDGHELPAAQEAASDDLRIKFMGRLNGDDLKKVMASADCLVVPSLCYENSPTIIYEAQNAGLKIIAAALGGIPEIISDPNRLFKAGDEFDLLEKLKNFSN